MILHWRCFSLLLWQGALFLWGFLFPGTGFTLRAHEIRSQNHGWNHNCFQLWCVQGPCLLQWTSKCHFYIYYIVPHKRGPSNLTHLWCFRIQLLRAAEATASFTPPAPQPICAVRDRSTLSANHCRAGFPFSDFRNEWGSALFKRMYFFDV